MGTITVRVDDDLKRRMKRVKINWSEFIRNAIAWRVEVEERREAGERLLEDLRAGRHTVPRGFINEELRRMRESR